MKKLLIALLFTVIIAASAIMFLFVSNKDEPYANIFLSTNYTDENYRNFVIAYEFMNLWNEEIAIVKHPLFPGRNLADQLELEPVAYFMQTDEHEYYYSRDVADIVKNYPAYNVMPLFEIEQFLQADLKLTSTQYSRSDYLQTRFKSTAIDAESDFEIVVPKRGPKQEANVISLSAYYDNKDFLNKFLTYVLKDDAKEAIAWYERKAKILYNPLYMHQDLQSGYFAKPFGEYLLQFNVSYQGNVDIHSPIVGNSTIFNDKMVYHMTITNAEQLDIIKDTPIKPIAFKQQTLDQFIDDVLRSYNAETQ